MAANVPIKVLLVEDDPFMSRMYQRVFNFEGFEIQLAENGQIGLSKLADFYPDVILLDVMMPVMDGKKTLTALKADPATKDIPVIMLTNLTDSKVAEELLQQGALHYIHKSDDGPAEVASLIRSIAKSSQR